MKCFVVIDTNVVLSALMYAQKYKDTDSSVPLKVLLLALDGKNKITPIFNGEIIDEYRDVLSREEFHAHIPEGAVTYEPDMWSALDGADALILVTEWKQFRSPDFARIKSMLKSPVIYDGRNQYDPRQMKALGIELHCIGRGLV